MRFVVVFTLAVLLAGCGRQYVEPERLGQEIDQHEALAEHVYSTGGLLERDRAHIAAASLQAARRAMTEGNTERAQVELEVARDLLRARP